MTQLDKLDSVQSLEELKVPPGNRLEALSGNRKGQYSIRINEQYCASASKVFRGFRRFLAESSGTVGSVPRSSG